MLPAFRRATSEINSSISIWDSKTMDDLIDQPLAQPRLSALLLTAFGLVALLVSAIGLYGLMATAVRQQTRDIGVRVALGATSRDVRRLILGEAMWVVGIGATAGLVIAVVATRLLASQLFGVSPSDPRSLLGACALLDSRRESRRRTSRRDAPRASIRFKRCGPSNAHRKGRKGQRSQRTPGFPSSFAASASLRPLR